MSVPKLPAKSYWRIFEESRTEVTIEEIVKGAEIWICELGPDEHIIEKAQRRASRITKIVVKKKHYFRKIQLRKEVEEYYKSLNHGENPTGASDKPDGNELQYSIQYPSGNRGSEIFSAKRQKSKSGRRGAPPGRWG